jgi:tetratricopeptide (TPR) repeat protein
MFNAKTMTGFRQLFLPALWLLLLATATPLTVGAQTNDDDSFFKAITAKFSTWDKNHNQSLSVGELDAAIEDPANTGQAAAALAALKRASRSTNYTLPLLTLQNIRQLATNTPATNQPNLQRLYSQCFKLLSGATNRDFFASGLPQLNTVRQGRMGDCFCLAPLGAMIHRDPREVASLFTIQADGRVSVEFGGGPVSVKPPTDAELAMTAGNTHDGVWINLYEKAIGTVRNGQVAPEKRSDLPIDAIAKGGSEGRIMSYLTGHKVKWFSFKFAKEPATSDAARAAKMEELRQKLAAAAREKRLMACATEKPTTPGVTPKHAYAVLTYDSQADTVELWNPHGNSFTPKGPPGLSNGYVMTNGLLTVPVTEFVQQFSGVTFESKFPDISLQSAVPMDISNNLKVGDPAPKWKTGKWIQGEPIKKFDSGKAYLVEFWATWSESSRIAIPYLNELQNRYQDKGLMVIGQDCWERDAKEVAPFLKAMGEKMSYRVAQEDRPLLGKSRLAPNWLTAAGRGGLPTAFLIDKQGTIAWIGNPMGLPEPLIQDVLAGTFDTKKVAAENARQQEARALFKQASDLTRDGKLAQAEARLDRLLAATNGDGEQTAQLLALRAKILARTTRWEQAAADLARATQLDPSEYFSWYMLTPLLIESGKVAEYRAHCKAMLDRFEDTTSPGVAEVTAKACLLLPSAVGPDELTLAAKAAESAVALSAKGERMYWRLMTRGLAEYRQGRFTNAIETMQLSQQSLNRLPVAALACKADAYFVMALARHQIKQPSEARAALASGLEIVQQKLPRLDGGDLGEAWFDILPAYILMREARETIEGMPAKNQHPARVGNFAL